jgi:hypothetical protein
MFGRAPLSKRPPGRTLLLAASILGYALAVPSQSLAQSCLAQPVGRNELWVAGSAEWGGPAVQGGGLVAANVADAVGIEWGVGWGGYEDQAGSPSTVHVRVLSLLRLGTKRVCPFVEWRGHDRSMRWNLDVTHGKVSERAIRIGAALGGDLPTLLGTRLGWQATAGLLHRDWDLEGRRTVVDDEVYVLQIHKRERSLHFTATAALSMRLGTVGLVIGVGTRPRTTRDFLGFVNVGIRVSG